jgi:hypothetical protein
VTASRTSAAVLLLALAGAGCAGNPERPATSSLECARAVVAVLPPGLSDPEKHCLASAGIAHHCSRFEAWLAGWGKEMRDAFGSGDASFADLGDDRRGRECARRSDDPNAWLQCCRE